MKKKVFSLMMTLLLAVTGFVRADELTVNDGTASNSYLPVYGLYADTQGCTSEFIIPSADLAGMNGGTISSLTFYLNQSASAAWTATFQVYLAEVTNTTLTDVNGPSVGTVVYTGTLDGTGSTMTVTFDNGYTYNGGNLLIGSYVQTAGNYKSAYFYGVSQTTATGYYRYSSYANGGLYFLPKTTFTYTAGGGETPGGGGGGSSEPEIGLHVRYDNGEEGRELVIDDLYLGEYPAGAWMEPFHFEMYNDDTQALTVSVLDFTPNTDALSMATGTELPFTVAGNSAEYIDLAIQVQAPADAEAGDYEYQFVAIYEGSRLAKIWPLSFTIYTPEIPDVVEKAYDLGTIADGYTYTGVPSDITPTVLHNDYTLPFPEIPEGNDAVYKFKVEGDMIISAYVDETNADGKVALYTEDFNGEAGPMAHNNYTGLTGTGGSGTGGGSGAAFEAMIGDDASTTVLTYYPFHTLWKYSIGENLFLASELAEAGVTTAPMTSLSWNVSSTTCTTPQSGISIWMANVSDTQLTSTSNLTNGMTLVYTGSNVLPTTGWNEFVFNEGSFAWDGHSNILVICQRLNGTWNGSVSWKTHNPGFVAASYDYDDSEVYDMTTQTYSMYTNDQHRANIIFKGGSRGARDAFAYGFEGGLEGWTTINVNAAGGTWVHSNNNPGGYMDPESYDPYYPDLANSGTGFAMSYSFVDYDGEYDTDSYLVSPQSYNLGNGASLNFFYDYANDDYPDFFEVCVATTAGAPTAADFTSVWSVGAKGARGARETNGVRRTTDRYGNWREVNIDLSAYQGQNVWVAFHHVDYDMYEVWIDDVTVNTGAGGGIVPAPASGNIAYGPVIENLPIQAGTYYLVASSTDADYTVHINAANMPCPAIEAAGYAFNPEPADDADDIDPASVTLRWTNPDYATGWRLVFGSTYYPEAGHPQTVIYPEDGSFSTEMANSYTVTNLWNNTNYFWHVEFNNGACPDGVSSPIWGFTTHLNKPQNLVATPEAIYEGETTTLTWNAITDRTYRSYRIYKDGVLLHTTTPNTNPEANLSWTVPASELTYNMSGYTFNVTAVYDEGESGFSNDAHVKVSGYSAEPGIYGYVYEQDSVTPIGGVTVTVTGTDEFGNAVNYSGTTDNNGYYTIHPVLAGEYATALAYCAGYQDAEPYTKVPPFTLPYQGTWGEMNFIMQEEFYPSPMVCAEVVQVGDDELVKVWWQIPDGTGGTGTGDFLSEYEAQVGNGSTPLGYVPFYTLYENSVSTMLYKADELAAAGVTPAPMTSISWNASNQNGDNQQGLTIWMANVTDNQVSTTSPTSAGMTKVYTGSMTPTTGWNEFVFNENEFAWDGSSNILILMQRNNGDWNFNAINWLSHSMANAASYAYRDNTSYNVEAETYTMAISPSRPNIIFKGGTRADRADRAMHHYRIYRTDCYYDGPYYEGDPGGTIVLASAWVPDTAYFDVSWPDAAPGVYKWGVGVVYEGNQADNPNNPRNESEIRWAENTLTSIAPTPVSYTEGIRDFVPRDGNATVILTAGDVWGDGSGYQMLLDADATAYGNELPETGALSLNCSGNEAIYNVFEYRIPANADGNCSTSNIVMNSSISLTIPAGTYDWCITNPTPGDRIWIASENGTIGGRADDFVFEANKVYEFLVYAGGINDAVDLFVTDGTPVGPTPTPGNTCDNMLALPRESCTVWSNECSGCIDKNMDIPSLDGEQFVSINVVLNSADSPEGTIVSFTNLHEGEQAAHPQENLTLDESGHHDFETFRRGTYAIQIYHEGFYTILDTVGIGVEPDMAYELRYVMEEILYPARDFYVSYTGFAMWGIESGWEGGEVPTGGGGGGGAAGETISENFDAGMPAGWISIDADGDGNGWLSSMTPGIYHNAGVDLTGSGHDGSAAFVISGSFANQTGQPLFPDNYLVTPQVALGGTFSFWACGQDANYAAEHFGVAVSTTGTNATDFTTIQEWTLTAKGGNGMMSVGREGANRAQGNWYQFSVDLSNYSGQGYVAIRHFNCSDQFILNIDDVEMGNGRASRHFEYYKVMCTSIDGQPIFNVDVTTPYCQLATDQLVENETYICKVAAVFSTGMSEWRETQWVYRSCENYAGTLNGVTINGSTISWDYPGGGPVPPVPPVPPTGEGLTEGFEGGLGDWTNIDADGDGNVWMTGRDEAHTGTGYAESESYINYVGALTPDNYLVSPQVTLGGTFTFWASAQDPSYAAEKFGVAVSTAGNTNAADFTTLQSWTMTSKSTTSTKAAVRGGTRAGTWYQYSVDLSAYAGQTGYVAIRHYDCTDQFILNVDDIELNAGSKGRANRDLTEGFEGGLGDWTNIDADGDGNVWMTGRDEAHTGTGYAESESYINYVGALTPDNYLVSPQVTLGGTFTFWASAQDPSYAAEKFGVAVSTAGNTNAADFTTLQSWTMTSKSTASTKAAVRGGTRAGTWYQYSVDLSAYAGQTGYVAIRHYDCTDQFILNVDDIELVNGGVTPTPTPTPAEGIIGAAIYQNGQPIAFVDYPTNTWTMPESGEYCVRIIYDGPMDGSYYSMSCEECEGGEVTCEANFTINGEYFWNSDDDFGARLWWGEGGVNPDPDPIVGDGDTFTVNFDDSQIPAGWTIIDNGNPAGYGWQLASNKIGTGNGHNGSTDCILSQSYDNNTGVVYPDNWFISPAVTLANGSTFSLWACGQDAGYAAEHFGVFVSTTGTNPSDFTMVNEWTIGAKSDRYDGPRGNRDQSTWTQYVVDLSAYAGTGRYIAIRHFNCSDMFYLDVDDLELSNGRNRDGVVLYNIYRSTDNVNYELIDTLEAEAGVTEYEYIDNTAEAGVTYYYQVTAVYDNDCESTPALVEGSTNDYVVIGVTSIGENTGKVALYPNPTSGNVKIEANGMRHITVVSSLGQVVYDADVNADEMDLNMGQFTTGVYVVRIVTETGINTQRVTVVR